MASLSDLNLTANPLVQKLSRQVRRTVDALVSERASFAEREETALAVSNEIARKALETDLQGMANRYAERIRIGAIEYKRHEEGEVTYHSLCGDVRVRRSSFRQTGVRNGPTVIPVELEAGLVERSTPALANNVALGYAQHDMRNHHEALVSARRVPPSRTTLETLAKRMAAAVYNRAPRITSYVRRSEPWAPKAHAMSLGLDRTSVPMQEERCPQAAPKTRRKTRREPYVRSPPAPIDVQWRMAYVGTVSVVDSQGNALQTRRYTATAEQGPARLVSQMIADVRTAIRHQRGLTIGIVQDGAPEMWNQLRRALAAEPTVQTWLEGIDKYHLLERLGNALQQVEPDEQLRRETLHRWTDQLDTDDQAIDRIQRWLRTRYANLCGDKANNLREHLVYLRNNKDRMRYATLGAAGLPVGSGVTEGAAKSVIGARTKGSGQRWSEPGLRGVLTMRAIHRSERFLAFWRHFSRGYVSQIVAVA